MRRLLLRAAGVLLVAMALTFLVLSLMVSTADAALSDCIDATCRITVQNGGKTYRGTGCVFEISQGKVWVLTNAHVATSTTSSLDFWSAGHQSRKVSGQTVMRNVRADAAVIAVDAAQFGARQPSVIPVADASVRLQSRDTITSVGCPAGAWASGWKGHVVRYDGSDLHFIPIPLKGRSGSAIFNAEGTHIIALLRGRDRETAEASTYGIATSAAAIRNALSTGTHNTQCGPDGCGPNGCPVDNSQWRISPYRSEQDDINRDQNRAIGSLYPTLPARPMVPVSPPLDIRPIVSGLDRLGQGQDRIAELLIEIREAKPAPATPIAPYVPTLPLGTPPAMPPPAFDPAFAPELLAHDAMLAAEDVKADLEETKEETSKLRTAINALIGDRDTLRDRVEERLTTVKAELGADASRREIAGAYVRDYAAERLGSGSGAGLTMGKMVAGALGLSGPLAAGLAAAGWLAGRRIKRRFGSDDDDGESRLSGLIGRLGDKVDDIKDRVRGTSLQPAVAAAPQPTIIAMPAAQGPPATPVQPAGQVIVIPTPAPVAPVETPPQQEEAVS